MKLVSIENSNYAGQMFFLTERWWIQVKTYYKIHAYIMIQYKMP